MKYLLNTLLWVSAMVFSTLLFQFAWNTFIQPLGAPDVSFGHAMGLGLVADTLKIPIYIALSRLPVKDEMTYGQVWVASQIMKLAAFLFMLLASALM
jgi:hypothetical protein